MAHNVYLSVFGIALFSKSVQCFSKTYWTRRTLLWKIVFHFSSLSEVFFVPRNVMCRLALKKYDLVVLRIGCRAWRRYDGDKLSSLTEMDVGKGLHLMFMSSMRLILGYSDVPMCQIVFLSPRETNFADCTGAKYILGLANPNPQNLTIRSWYQCNEKYEVASYETVKDKETYRLHKTAANLLAPPGPRVTRIEYSSRWTYAKFKCSLAALKD